MFICNECLNENYQNRQSLFKSSGKCEHCEKSKTCNEIKSSMLVEKPNYDKFIYDDCGNEYSKDSVKIKS